MANLPFPEKLSVQLPSPSVCWVLQSYPVLSVVDAEGEMVVTVLVCVYKHKKNKNS